MKSLKNVSDINYDSYWNQFAVSYSNNNTHLGINAGSLNNNSLFTLVGEKSLDYVKIRDRDNDPDEDHLEFYFDDNNQGYNLKDTANDNSSQRYEMDYDDISILSLTIKQAISSKSQMLMKDLVLRMKIFLIR